MSHIENSKYQMEEPNDDDFEGTLGEALMKALDGYKDLIRPSRPLPTPYPAVIDLLTKIVSSENCREFESFEKTYLAVDHVSIEDYMRAHITQNLVMPITGVTGLDVDDISTGTRVGTGPLFIISDGETRPGKLGTPEKEFVVENASYVVWIGQREQDEESVYFYQLQTPKKAGEVRRDLRKAGIVQLPPIKFEGQWGAQARSRRS